MMVQSIIIDEGSESTSSTSGMPISFTQLQAILGRFMFGVRIAPTDAAQLADVNAAIREGLQAVYTPPPIDQTGKVHQWSFMRPVYPITTIAATYQYSLPVNFGGIEGPIEYAPGTSGYYPEIKIVKLQELQRRLSILQLSMRPEIAALESVTIDPSVGSRWRLWLYPIPDAAYALSFIMKAMPTMIDVGNPYPLGGDTLALLIQESCLAAAERLLDEKEGVHGLRFKEMLVAAIKADAQSMSPDTLGQSINPDRPENSPLEIIQTGAIHTYHGNIYY